MKLLRIFECMLLISFGISVYFIEDEFIRPLFDKTEINQLINYCKHEGIYSKNRDYEKIVKTIHKYSELFELDSYIVKGICIRESECYQYSVNTNRHSKGFTLDIGVMQVNLYYWGDCIQEMDRMKKVLKNTNSLSAIRDVMFDIDHNIYMGCFILKSKLIEQKGNLYMAIARYNGSKDICLLYAQDVIRIANELKGY